MTVRLAPTLDAAPAAGEDLVFCATLGLAWGALRALDGAPPLAAMVPATAVALDALVAGPPPLESAVPAEASFVAAGGPVELGAAREALRARFPDLTSRLLPDTLPPDGLFAFGFLDRALAFDPPFDPTTVMFASAMVKGFGVGGADPRAANVVVHDYRAGESFLVELRARSEDRILVLADVPAGPFGPPPVTTPRTLRERVSDALARLDQLPPAERTVVAEESFSMPNVRLDQAGSFDELTAAPIALADGRVLRIDDARQCVRFALDETGAKVTSEARLLSFGPPPRVLSVSGPFVVMLLRRGATVPYLAAWIQTAATMERVADAAPVAGPWKLGPPTGFGGFGSFGGSL